MVGLWNKEKEKEFFYQSFKFGNLEKLFYLCDNGKYYAYYPKNYKGKKLTLQSRNYLIGNFTEKYSVDLLQSYSKSKGLYAVQDVVCNEIGLTNISPADFCICKTNNRHQTVENIVVIFEVKMSIVWNWEFINNELVCVGDFNTHQGTPGLLRSDSMLKAIGKSINIRVSGLRSAHIPIIILGNTPIQKSYYEKTDHLKNNGIIQGFISVNKNPINNDNYNIKNTLLNGFIRIDKIDELYQYLDDLLDYSGMYFPIMKTKEEIGKIIEISNMENTYELKAEKFLYLIKG
ncbi:MAG: hypothetical protein QF864_12265 [SAR202 cluster bacterium]|nr:hypothetical protein [SAR202 cluster bacterium]